jgi:hypothetical protein
MGPESADFIFYARQTTALNDSQRTFSLNARDFGLLNPNTRTCPIFRGRRDAELAKLIYRRVPILIKDGPPEENPWAIRFSRMFDMANDSGFFHSSDQLEEKGATLKGNVFLLRADRYLPLFEAKMFHLFNHRFSTYEGASQAQINLGSLPTPSIEKMRDPHFSVMPQSWVRTDIVHAALPDRWSKRWLLGWRDITNPTNERTLISAIIPLGAVGDTFLLIFPGDQSAQTAFCLEACLNSFVADYCARQKLGGMHLKYHVFKQVPVIAPAIFHISCPLNTNEASWAEWIARRAIELTYTAYDLEDLGSEWSHNLRPFKWNEDRRFLLRCELDAAFFHLYLGTPEDWQKEPESLTSLFPSIRSAVEYIMETFPIVKRQDVKTHGRYRTKETILEIYDAMAHATKTGQPYQTLLDPPAADSSLAHDSALPAPAAEERAHPRKPRYL